MKEPIKELEYWKNQLDTQWEKIRDKPPATITTLDFIKLDSEIQDIIGAANDVIRQFNIERCDKNDS